MGGKWHMPTKEQFEELLDEKNTVRTWISDYCHSGISGRLFKSRINNETLFIPANGFINASYQKSVSCLLWTSSLNFSFVYTYTYFTSGKFFSCTTTICSYNICMGVRGVFNTFWVK